MSKLFNKIKNAMKDIKEGDLTLHLPAIMSCDMSYKDSVGYLYYFKPMNRAQGPYKKQIRVTAIIDIADDGTFAGVELIDNMPPPYEG